MKEGKKTFVQKEIESKKSKSSPFPSQSFETQFVIEVKLTQ